MQLKRNRRKIGEKWDNLGQISHVFKSHFPHFSTASPTFPSLMNFASQTNRLEKCDSGDSPTLPEFSASAEGCEGHNEMQQTVVHCPRAPLPGWRLHRFRLFSPTPSRDLRCAHNQLRWSGPLLTPPLEAHSTGCTAASICPGARRAGHGTPSPPPAPPPSAGSGRSS